MVDKKNDTSEFVSSRICDETAEMFPKLTISSSRKSVPHNVFARPEQRDKTIQPFVVSERWNVNDLSSFCPTPFDFWEEFNPFFILESDENLFFKSAGAIRL